MSDKTALDVLFEGLDKGILTEEVKTKLTQLINETVDVRVSAKEKLLKEEFDALKAKNAQETEELKKKLNEESEANEKVLVEQAEKFKKELEETIVEQASKFKSETDAKFAEDTAKYRSEVEAMVLTEAKEFKEKQDAALVEEVKNFKAGLVEKISDYLDAKVKETIPAEIMESAAKLAVYQPLVESVMEGFTKNFIKLDTTSYSLIKEAKDKIAEMEKQLQESKKVEITIKKEKREVEKQMKMNSLTEGLTTVQKAKAVKLLEGVELEDLEPRFKKIRDIIIESEVKPVEKKVEKIEESKQPEPVKVPEKKTETPIANKAVIDHQVKAVLSESQVKSVASPVKSENKSDDKTMSSWAKKIKPKYQEEPKKS